MPAAVLDACVLFPNVLRDTLLTIAEEELYRPMWSEAIFAELRRNIVAKRGVAAEAIDRTLAVMDSAFDGAMVDGWQGIADVLELPDPDDRHVLAAAIVGQADVIVTLNLRDFPQKRLGRHGIEAVHPSRFLLSLLDVAPRQIIGALKDQIARYRKPPMDMGELLSRLDRCGLSDFTEEVRRLIL
jgi:predicted nucleic acid-binding protein